MSQRVINMIDLKVFNDIFEIGRLLIIVVDYSVLMIILKLNSNKSNDYLIELIND